MKNLSGKSRKYCSEILIFSFFILLTIVATYPLIFRMKSYLYGLGGDPFGTVWKFRWLKYAHINRLFPSICSLIASPFGVDYSQSVTLPVTDFFAKWLSQLLNEIFAYNFIILLTFLLSTFTMYYLVYHFTRDKLASMISGIIYAFSPYHLIHATQHLGTTNIQWMPLYALSLFYLDEKRSYKGAFLIALAFSLVVFSEYHYALFMVVFTITFVVWRMWQGIRGRKISSYQAIKQSSDQGSSPPAGEAGKGSRMHLFKVVLVAAVVASAIILPLTYHPFQNMFATPERYARPLRDLFSNSARPLGYLLPSQDNPFFGRFTKKFIDYSLYGGHPTEHTLYLGWVGIILSLVAIRGWRKKSKLVNKLTSRQVNKSTRSQKTGDRNWQTGKLANWSTKTQKAVSFFLFAGIVALLFSHAPYMDIGNFRIFFPSYFMYKLLPMVRVYARLGIVVMLCVSVLAGIGLASILEKIKSVKKKRVFLSIVLLLIFIEFAPTLPAPMVNAVNPPPVYEWLAKQEGNFIIAEYPLEDDQEYLFWQRIHQKRLVNGALSGTYADKVRKEIVDILKPETLGILSYLGAKYVILHPEKYLKSEDVPVIGEVPDVSKQKGLRLIKTFEEAQIYEVVARPQRPQSKP